MREDLFKRLKSLTYSTVKRSPLWNPQIFAGAGYGVVAINFHGSTGYGQNFTDSVYNNWGSYPFYDIETGLDHILSKYPYLDGERVAGMGGSYGGYMVNWLNGHSKKFKVLVNHAGVFSTTQMYYTGGKYCGTYYNYYYD
jgi:dipeptidyl aminopeptidase/acylaminoacyl peptidase